jgi:3-oxoacyl-[acyl-carrier protein] reductase
MLTDKVALITGGTKGIGRSIVELFLANSAHVITTYSKDDVAAKTLSEELEKKYPKKIEIHKGSVLDIGFIQNLLQKVKNTFGKLDILVNNAGITRDSLFLETSKEAWRDVLATNMGGTLNFSILASDLMKKTNGFSHIINITSISGIFGRSGQAHYACSKGAIIGATKLLAKKYRDLHIRVNSLSPGLIATEMVDTLSEEKYSEVVNATILKRIGHPDEVAKTALFLASENSSYISGTCVRVDGGFLK